MSTSNGATSIYVGEVMPKVQPDNKCAELEEANKEDVRSMAESKDLAIKKIVVSSVVKIDKTVYKAAVKKAKDKLTEAKAVLRQASGAKKAAAKAAVKRAQKGVASAKKRTHKIKGGKSTITNAFIQTPGGKGKFVAGCSKGSAIAYKGKFAKGRREMVDGTRTKGKEGAVAHRGTGDAKKDMTRDKDQYDKKEQAQRKKAGKGEGYKKGDKIPAGEVEDRQSFLCPEAEFEYKTGNSSPHQAHTESRLIEDFMRDNGGKKSAKAGGLGTMTMNVRWETVKVKKDKNGKAKALATTSKEACGNCQRLICAAMECGLDVYMCNDEGEAVKPDCEDGKFAKNSSSSKRGSNV